jgi:hypothetical protein
MSAIHAGQAPSGQRGPVREIEGTLSSERMSIQTVQMEDVITFAPAVGSMTALEPALAAALPAKGARNA